jgi:hypothetical protein
MYPEIKLLENDKNSLKERLKHYQNVSESLGNEIEFLAKSKKGKAELLSADDIELLMMSKEFFNEFIEDFQNDITPEEKEKIDRINSMIDKIITIYGKSRYNNLFGKE